MDSEKEARELWEDYVFLTREISKFIDKQDFDLVLELLNQRDKLQELIEAVPEGGYTTTQEGKETLLTLQNLNQVISTKLQRLRNTTKRSQQVDKAYDQMSNIYAGSFMDRKS